MFILEDDTKAQKAKIKVVGVGGGGGNALNTMIRAGLDGVEFIAMNTDAQDLERNLAPVKVQLGVNLTKGLGAGADPECGRKAAEEAKPTIEECLAGADMVFVTAGMGGGTGTGAAPIVAEIAHEQGALVVGVVTKPFSFEGEVRRRVAEQGIQQLLRHVDTLLTIPNDKLLLLNQGRDLKFIEAFHRADQVLLNAVRGISDLITKPGYINVDFADVRTVMRQQQGSAMMGLGEASGEGRAAEAAERALNSPLLEDIEVCDAKGVLVNVAVRQDTFGVNEMSEVMSYVNNVAHEEARVIVGVTFDDELGDALRVTVIATGFPLPGHLSRPPLRPLPGGMAGPQGTRSSSGGNVPMGAVPSQPGRAASQPKSWPDPLADSKELDIPAFLRRQAD